MNPRIDQPEDHLTFDQHGLVHPRPDAHGVDSAMGTMSITVYALQRKLLVESRLRVLNAFRLLFEQLNHLVKSQNDLKTMGAPASMIAHNLTQIANIRNGMLAMLGPTDPYLAMLREWIRAEKRNGDCALLEQLGIDLTALIPSVGS